MLNPVVQHECHVVAEIQCVPECEQDINAARKNDTSLRQTLDDMACDTVNNRRSGDQEMTRDLGTYVCHERGEEFCL